MRRGRRGFEAATTKRSRRQQRDTAVATRAGRQVGGAVRAAETQQKTHKTHKHTRKKSQRGEEQQHGRFHRCQVCDRMGTQSRRRKTRRGGAVVSAQGEGCGFHSQPGQFCVEFVGSPVSSHSLRTCMRGEWESLSCL